MVEKLLCFVLLFIAAAAFPTTLDGPFRPTTIPYDDNLVPGSDDLPASDPRFARLSGPEQISVAIASETGVYISWVTGDSKLVNGTVELPKIPADEKSIVNYVQDRPSSPPKVAEGYAQAYTQEYPYEGLLNYSSGIIHHVRLTGLLPNTRYNYSVGDGVTMSRVLNFTTMPSPGASSYPERIVILGDLGLTTNSSSTVDHIIQNNPDLFVMIGDLTYADNHLTNGTGAVSYKLTFKDSPTHETHQPRWDYWGRFMEKLISRVPMMVIEGNHEIELQINNKTFEAYKARYAVPAEESGSNSKLYYSFNAGGIHFIMLGSYAEYGHSSEQYLWLELDLARIDRSITPWVIATMHAPWYSSYKSHYREGECMRQAMEKLLYKYRVDIIYAGHIHAYERMNRVNNYTLDPCGPVHITVGDGGNIERIQRDYADMPGMCPTADKVKPSLGKTCLFNFTEPKEAENSLCWSTQPSWSAIRDPSFGHGILSVKNSTHALWTWYRNQDAFDSNVQGDQLYIVRQPEVCHIPHISTPAPAPQPPSPTPTPPPPPSPPKSGAIVVSVVSMSCLIIAVLFMLQ